MYPYSNYQMPQTNFYENTGDRFFPLITGAIIGGAAVGLSRPRPVYVNPVPYPTYGYGYPYGAGYNYGNYGYYNYR